MNFFYYLLLLTCLLINKNSHAQNFNDAGMWNTISLEKGLGNKFSIGIDEEFRLRNNFTMLNLFYTNLSINYKPIKSLKIGIAYRFIDKWQYENQQFSFRHRLMLDLSYKYKLINWSISYRSRIQFELRDIQSDDLGKVPQWYWRHKLDIKYAIQKFKPNIGAELRYQIVDPRMPETDMGWHRIRTYAGVDYEINDINTFGIYYLIQNEFDINKPNNIYILGIQYSIQLK